MAVKPSFCGLSSLTADGHTKRTTTDCELVHRYVLSSGGRGVEFRRTPLPERKTTFEWAECVLLLVESACRCCLLLLLLFCLLVWPRWWSSCPRSLSWLSPLLAVVLPGVWVLRCVVCMAWCGVVCAWCGRNVGTCCLLGRLAFFCLCFSSFLLLVAAPAPQPHAQR